MNNFLVNLLVKAIDKLRLKSPIIFAIVIGIIWAVWGTLNSMDLSNINLPLGLNIEMAIDFVTIVLTSLLSSKNYPFLKQIELKEKGK